MEQLVEEDARYKQQKKVEKAQRDMMDEFQKQMGNYAKEQRMVNYIRKVTIGNVDVLDPTGTAIRIDASKVTVQKTHAFGLGTVRPEEIDKVDQDMNRAKRKMAKWKPPRPQDPDDIPISDIVPDSPRQMS